MRTKWTLGVTASTFVPGLFTISRGLMSTFLHDKHQRKKGRYFRVVYLQMEQVIDSEQIQKANYLSFEKCVQTFRISLRSSSDECDGCYDDMVKIQTKPQQIGSAQNREPEKMTRKKKEINKWFCECQHWHWHRIKAFLIYYLPEISISYLFAHQNLRMALIFPYEIPLYIIPWHVSDFLYPTQTHRQTQTQTV